MSRLVTIGALSEVYRVNEEEQQHRLERARAVLREIHHIPIATVNEDGSPHSSPVLLALDDLMHGFWGSSPESMHSQNIVRDPRVFLAVFDSRGGHSGLFLSGAAKELADLRAIRHGLELLDELKRTLYGDGMADVASYMDDGEQRIYEFIPEHAWVNHSERQGGVIVRDRRYEIPIQELLAG